MKYFPIILFFTIIYTSHLNAQYHFSFEAGYSDFHFKDKTGEDVRNSYPDETLSFFVEFDRAFSFKATIDREVAFNKFSLFIGPSVQSLGANHSFFDKWIHTYTGIHLGTDYKLGKTHLSFNTTPSIRLWATVQEGGPLLGRKPELQFLFDVNPSIKYKLSDQLMTNIGFTYSLNNVVSFGEEIKHKAYALRLGLSYKFRKSKAEREQAALLSH